MPDNSYSKILDEIKNLGGLHVENLKLQLTEKLTLLLAKVMLVAIVFIMTVAALLFLTIAGARCLTEVIDPALAYCIVAAFYLLIAVLAFVFRKQWIINPIARFVSRVILDAPKSKPMATPTNALRPSSNPKPQSPAK